MGLLSYLPIIPGSIKVAGTDPRYSLRFLNGLMVARYDSQTCTDYKNVRRSDNFVYFLNCSQHCWLRRAIKFYLLKYFIIKVYRRYEWVCEILPFVTFILERCNISNQWTIHMVHWLLLNWLETANFTVLMHGFHNYGGESFTEEVILKLCHRCYLPKLQYSLSWRIMLFSLQSCTHLIQGLAQ